jgi:transposase InsO family protein
MCRELGVTRQGYAAWRRRQGEPSARHVADVDLLDVIRDVYDGTQRRYGSPRVHRELRRRGYRVGRNRVARLMATHDLVGRPGRRPSRPRTTIPDPAATASPNVLDRDFTPTAPDRAWVTDITYLRTDQGFLYLAAIIDCYSRLVVGWAVAPHLRTELCLEALHDAVARRRPQPGLIHHSDRGCQYTSHDYRKRLHQLHMTQSMSRKGNCWDNAVAESFFSTLKLELVYTKHWNTHHELTAALFDYIEIFYNRQRLHSAVDYSTPTEYDQAHFQQIAA